MPTKTTKTANQDIVIELGNGTALSFSVERQHYISFVNSSNKNPFNAMQNFLADAVIEDSNDDLNALIANPANVTEIAGAVLEEYKPDIQVTVKKRKK